MTEDRLYDLLPSLVRARDADEGHPLRALLRVVTEQADLVERDIAQMYDDWFVETAADWAIPYLGALVGYRPVAEAGPSDGREEALVPRREVANALPYRRRKGTLALLDDLAADVSGWPSHAVEFYRLLGWNQNLNHPHPERARTVDVRQSGRLFRLDGPFDRLAHTVDVRRVDSSLSVGRHNVPSVGVYVWRLKAYSVTDAPALCLGDPEAYAYSFHVLGQKAPLFAKPVPGKLRPQPIERFELERHPERFYGEGKSFVIRVGGWPGAEDGIVPLRAIVAADLSDWRYVAKRGTVAVDPVLGRFAFHPDEVPEERVRVTYHYGFSMDMGGGEYPRRVLDPSPRGEAEVAFYRVGAGEAFDRIGDALAQWRQDVPLDAVIEVVDSEVYVEPVRVSLSEGATLHLRAAVGARPVIQVVGGRIDRADSLSVHLREGSRFTLEGFMVTGRALQVNGRPFEPRRAPKSEDVVAESLPCDARLTLRHCTLLPGWEIDEECEPAGPGRPSLELNDVRAIVRIESCILGPIRVSEDAVREDPIPVTIQDSILDATDRARIALSGPGGAPAHVRLTVERTTVLGIVEAHAVELAQDSIFASCLNVARRQIGCMRFCYVPPGCRTPRRYSCQPDLAVRAVSESGAGGDERDRGIALARARVAPQFESVRYGGPRYARLAPWIAPEIKRGAEDESEMGAFHDLFEPQRLANLRARLAEFTPAGMDVGVLDAL